jgi:hypothetical protein
LPGSFPVTDAAYRIQRRATRYARSTSTNNSGKREDRIPHIGGGKSHGHPVFCSSSLSLPSPTITKLDRPNFLAHPQGFWGFAYIREVATEIDSRNRSATRVRLVTIESEGGKPRALRTNTPSYVPKTCGEDPPSDCCSLNFTFPGARSCSGRAFSVKFNYKSNPARLPALRARTPKPWTEEASKDTAAWQPLSNPLLLSRPSGKIS